MHPRNLFQQRPDYTDLAIKHADFRKVCKLKLNGHVDIDYKNESTLIALSQVLLREYFQLNVEFAPGSLIPTIPQRLNYILWLEDLLKLGENGDNFIGLKPIRGIDIGCGSSCIYSLLAARLNKWSMVALEANEINLSYAKRNIVENNLESLIFLYAQEDSNQIFSKYFNSMLENNSEPGTKDEFDFCLCNPPFYDLNSFPVEEMLVKRKRKRPPPSNCPTGFQAELYCEGGEVQFVQNIINESIEFKHKIRIFTSLLGHKSSVEKIISILKSHNITNYTKTQFMNGKTMRWIIAWSFNNKINLNDHHVTSVPDSTSGDDETDKTST